MAIMVRALKQLREELRDAENAAGELRVDYLDNPSDIHAELAYGDALLRVDGLKDMIRVRPSHRARGHLRNPSVRTRLFINNGQLVEEED